MGNSVSRVEKKVSTQRTTSSISSAKTRKLHKKSASKPSAKRAVSAKLTKVVASKVASKTKTISHTKPGTQTKAKSARASTTKTPSRKTSPKSVVKQTKPLKTVKTPPKVVKSKSLVKSKPTVKAKPMKAVPPLKSRIVVKPVPRQPSRDEAAALAAFERAHKEFARGRFSEARLLFQNLIQKHVGVSEVTARARTYLAVAESRLQTSKPSLRDAEDLYDRGVIELNRGSYVDAQEMFERALKGNPEAAHIHYGLAAAQARLGSSEAALQSLEHAFELQPFLRSRAQHDPDLAVLRSAPDFERLINAMRQ